MEDEYELNYILYCHHIHRSMNPIQFFFLVSVKKFQDKFKFSIQKHYQVIDEGTESWRGIILQFYK